MNTETRPMKERAVRSDRGEQGSALIIATLVTVILALLGLSGQPSRDSIRGASRQLARRWHPDRHPEAGELTRAALCRRFAQISDAYQELINELDAAPAARVASAR